MKEILKKSNYKAILHSKRANIYYLEKCRVMQKDGRVVYLTESSDENLFLLPIRRSFFWGAAHP